MLGYLIMAVREARRARADLQGAEILSALSRLCWAWRYLSQAETLTPGEIRASGGWLRSHARASRAVDTVKVEFARRWTLRERTRTQRRRALKS